MYFVLLCVCHGVVESKVDTNRPIYTVKRKGQESYVTFITLLDYYLLSGISHCLLWALG